MVTIKEQVAVMANDITYIKKSLDENKIEHRTILTYLENLDKKYASKLTERIVYGLVTLVVTAFITKLLSLW